MARTAKQDQVRELQRTLYRAAKADPGRRFHALYGKVYRGDVLERAWELVRAPGQVAVSPMTPGLNAERTSGQRFGQPDQIASNSRWSNGNSQQAAICLWSRTS
jgi:hypothetical protein